MPRQRYIPFGYMMRAGEIAANPAEAAVVRSIFEQYTGGASYASIAEALSGREVRYHADTPGWNKHMVKRILENGKYAGESQYPRIIDPGDFCAAGSIRTEKSAGWERQTDCVKAVKQKAVCGECGSPVQKNTSTRRNASRINRWWRCGNAECDCMLRMTDAELEGAVTALLNRVIADPGLLRLPPPREPPVSLAAGRLNNELNRELNKPQFDGARALRLIMASAAERYAAAGDGAEGREVRRLRAELGQREPMGAFDSVFFEAVTDALLLSADGSVALRLKGGAVITEKEKEAVRNERHA